MRIFNKSSAKPNNILTDEASAAAYWNTCTIEQTAETLDGLRQRIDEQMVRGRMLGPASMQAVLYLDAAAYPLLEKLEHQYLQNARMPQVWQTEQLGRLTSFVASMLKPYITFLQDTADTQFGAMAPASTPLPLLAQIIARGLRYLGLTAKLDYFQNLIPDQKLWRHVHRLYRLAEDASASRLTVAGRFPATTCEDEWLKAVMLATVNQGSLKPRQIEQVYLWLDALSKHMVPELEPDPARHQYQADIEGYSPAVRFNGEPTAVEGRFWGTSELLYRLGESRKALQATQSAALSGLASFELFQRMEQWWTPETALLNLRTLERQAAGGEKLVLSGFDDIMNSLKSSVRASRGGKAEIWPVRDLSENGLGLAVRANHPWARLTALMLVGEPNQIWQVAVLRRVVFERGARDGHVGLQWLAHHFEIVRIENTGISSARGGLVGLYIGDDAQEPNPRTLIMPASAYRAAAQIGLSTYGGDSMGFFRLDDVLVQGEDWVMVRTSPGRP